MLATRRISSSCCAKLDLCGEHEGKGETQHANNRKQDERHAGTTFTGLCTAAIAALTSSSAQR